MIKKAIVISAISIFVVIALTATKILNIQQIEATGGDASSYHDFSAIIYVVCGVLLCLVAVWTYKVHIVAGIIPLGFGITSLGYGLYICSVKGFFGITGGLL